LTKNISYANRLRNSMQQKIKLWMAAWLAIHMEKRARRLRRALRDYERAELRRIQAADRRARGLRLYAAWFRKDRVRRSYQPFVSLQTAEELADRPSKRAA
jgi:hypothetical protein